MMSLNGDRSFTIDQVAALVNISPSTVYHHFQNKDALIAAVNLRSVQGLAPRRR